MSVIGNILSRLLNRFGAVVMCGLWLAICSAAGWLLAIALEVRPRLATGVLFVLTMALAAWRTQTASLDDHAESSIARSLAAPRSWRPTRRELSDADLNAFLIEITLLILTTLPAIAVGMFLKVFQSQMEE